MLDRIEEIRAEAAAAIEAAGGTAELEELRVRYLGRKAELTSILRGIAEPAAGGAGPGRQRRQPGPPGARGAARGPRRRARRGRAREQASPRTGSTSPCPGRRRRPAGHLHLITRTTRQIEDVMVGLGYRVMEGPEVEHDYYNFTALNHPPGHPARMLQDTFYVQSDPEVLLRTHTSPVQTRAMEAEPPPIFVIVPGKVYRRDSDATHSPMFHQVEGLAIGEGITLADLQGTLEEMLRAIFGAGREARMRPALLPLHRAERRVRRLLLRLRRDRHPRRRRALRPLQGDRLDRGRRRRDGRPQRPRVRRRQRLRPRAGPGLRLRDGGRADRDAAPRRPRPAPLLRQRRPGAGAVLDEGPVLMAARALRPRDRGRGAGRAAGDDRDRGRAGRRGRPARAAAASSSAGS